MTAASNKPLNCFDINLASANFILLLFIFVGTTVHAAPNIHVENYPGGQLHYKVEVDDQQEPHGWYREYTEAGILKAERQYDHGVRHGISRLYYTTGELMTEWNYREGKRHGPSLGFFKSGRLKDQGAYLDDRLEGEVLKYYPSGALKARMSFKKDRLENESTIYYKNGQIQHIYRYFKGRVWTRKDYSPDGKFLRKQEFPIPPNLP
jgi:antitoxin component YwqK of YwqJK toxin-antitoxin module